MSTEREALSGCGTEGLASEIGSYSIYNNDCLKQMASMGSDSVDAIVTGLAFMGAKWDSFNGGSGNQTISERQAEGKRYADENKGAPRYANSHGKKVTREEMVAFQAAMTPIFEEALRVAKPGAHLLCFGGTRTFHRMACAIEDAGWIVFDCIMWVYGSGFPHGMDVGKAIDKALGAERKKVPNVNSAKPSPQDTGRYGAYGPTDYVAPIPATDQAHQWNGWNTALKPAWEPIIVARKPLDGTVAHNVLTWGVGALNIDACRVVIEQGDDVFAKNPHTRSKGKDSGIYGRYNAQQSDWSGAKGRFPANLVHDGSDEVTALFPETGRSSGGGMHTRGTAGHESTNTYGDFTGGVAVRNIGLGDSGSAARFFYCAKASKKERNSGCEDYLTWEHDQELTLLLEKSNQLLRDMCASGTPKAEDVSLFTESSGNEQTGLSQTEWSFITSTVTRLTTDLKTSSSSQSSNISESILDAIRTSEESGISLARLAEQLSHSKQDSTDAETGTVTSAVAALFNALSEIRNCARKGNLHPTVKPNALMRWLVRLVCPQGGIVLDPFMGSGSTGVACIQESMRFVGIELDEHYCEIAERRISESDMGADEDSDQMKLFE